MMDGRNGCLSRNSRTGCWSGYADETLPRHGGVSHAARHRWSQRDQRHRSNGVARPFHLHSAPMSLPARLSYAFIALLIIAAGWLHLATPLVTVLFCFFALHVLSFGGRKWLGISLFLILLLGAGVGFYFFTKQPAVALPHIAETTIPVVLEW